MNRYTLVQTIIDATVEDIVQWAIHGHTGDIRAVIEDALELKLSTMDEGTLREQYGGYWPDEDAGLCNVGEEDRIAGAWRTLTMPRLEQRRAVFEHGQWWVTGYDNEDDPRTYSVVEATGPGSFGGLAFEEC